MTPNIEERLDEIIRFANIKGYVGGDNKLRSDILALIDEARVDENKRVAEYHVGIATKTMKRSDLKAYLVYRIAQLTKSETPQ